MEKYLIYKPTRNHDGAASSWELKYKPDPYKKQKDYCFFFLTVAPQDVNSEDRRFLWEHGIVLKLSLADLGELLAVIEGMQTEVAPKGQIYHQNQDGNKTLSFTWLEEHKKFGLKASAQRKDGQVFTLKHTVSIGESLVLRELIRTAIPKIVGWDRYENVQDYREGNKNRNNEFHKVG